MDIQLTPEAQEVQQKARSHPIKLWFRKKTEKVENIGLNEKTTNLKIDFISTTGCYNRKSID